MAYLELRVICMLCTSVRVVGGEEENKKGGRNIMVLEYSAQINPRPLCALTARANGG